MYNILLCKLDKKQPTTPGAALMFEKVYTIATAATEAQALKTAHYIKKRDFTIFASRRT